MAFRSPLRNEWEKYKPQMELAKEQPGYGGVMARLMLDFMPVMVDAFERERDKGTNPKLMLSAMTGIIMNLAEQAIKAAAKDGSQRDALRIMQMRLHEEVTKRLAEPKKHGAILLPGQP